MTTAFLCLFLFLLLLLTLFLIGILFFALVLVVQMALSLGLGLSLDLTPEDWDKLELNHGLCRKFWDMARDLAASAALKDPFTGWLKGLVTLRFAHDRAARIAVLSEIKASIFSFSEKKAS